MTDRKTGLSIAAKYSVTNPTRGITAAVLCVYLGGEEQEDLGHFNLEIKAEGKSQCWSLGDARGAVAQGVAASVPSALSRAKRAFKEFLADKHKLEHEAEVDEILRKNAVQ